jgi:type I restriction enzyme S subunit
MSKIVTTTLEKVCRPEKGEIISGPFGSNISSKYFVKEGIPVIRGNNLSLSLDKFYDDGFVFVTQEKADELNCYADRKDLVFTAAGTIGQVGLIPENSKFDRYVISNKQIRVRIDSNKIDVLYAYYWFASPWIQRLLTLSNKGSTVPLLTLWEVKNLPVSYPEDIEEQHRIALVLETITKRIENNNKINKELESMAKTIYDYWFLQFEFPNEDGKPYKSSDGKMVWSEELKREIPEGWKVKRIDDFGKLNNGINYNKNEVGDKSYKIVNVRNISETSLLLSKTKMDDIVLTARTADNYLLKENDILIARSGIPGAVRILNNDIENTIYCGFIICLRLASDLYRRYLVYKLKDYENTTATTSGGTIMQNVSQSTLKSIKFAVPEKRYILKFNEKIDSIWSNMQNNEKENQALVSLRNFLLPLLMNGQVGFKDVV